MYVRPLRYSKPAAQMLLDIFNYTNKAAFEPWQLTFGLPVKIEGQTPPDIVIDHLNDYNQQRSVDGTLTTIEVFPTPESGWTDSQVITYRRHVIQDYFISVPFVVYAVEPATDVILNALLEQYGLYLDADLIEMTFDQINLSDVLFQTHMGSILNGDGGDFVAPVVYNAVIKIKDEHPIFMGELNVYVREAVKFLDRDVKTTLEVRRYLGPGDHNKMPAEMILPNNRFVDDNYQMISLKINELVGEWIVEKAKQITGDNWVFTSEQAPFNLYGARVAYNGLNTGEIYIDDPKVSNALIIQFSDLHCSNIRGQWVMGYYNRETWQRRERIDYLPIQDR